MLDVRWVDEQIERVKSGTATMQAARDFALLCIAREHLAPHETAHDEKSAPESLPTLEQVEAELSKINITTKEDRRKAQEMREAVRIMGGQ